MVKNSETKRNSNQTAGSQVQGQIEYVLNKSRRLNVHRTVQSVRRFHDTRQLIFPLQSLLNYSTFLERKPLLGTFIEVRIRLHAYIAEFLTSESLHIFSLSFQNPSKPVNLVDETLSWRKVHRQWSLCKTPNLLPLQKKNKNHTFLFRFCCYTHSLFFSLSWTEKLIKMIGHELDGLCSILLGSSLNTNYTWCKIKHE